MSKLPSLGPSLTHHLVENQRQMQRQANSSAFARSGITVTSEGVSAVTGSLLLQPGSITDLDLANPAVRQAVYLTTTAFAPTSTWVEVAGVDLTVPTDATRLLVTATCWVYAINNSAAVDDLHARVSLAAVDGQALLTPLPVAGYNTISAGLATLAEFLTPGSTLRLLASAKTTTGTFTTDPANTATLAASLTWLR